MGRVEIRALETSVHRNGLDATGGKKRSRQLESASRTPVSSQPSELMRPGCGQARPVHPQTPGPHRELKLARSRLAPWPGLRATTPVARGLDASGTVLGGTSSIVYLNGKKERKEKKHGRS